MEPNLEDLKSRLMASDEEFSRLASEHSNHEHRLQQLSSRPFLTDSEQLEATNLKKRKLSIKDQMEKILQRYKKNGCVTP